MWKGQHWVLTTKEMPNPTSSEKQHTTTAMECCIQKLAPPPPHPPSEAMPLDWKGRLLLCVSDSDPLDKSGLLLSSYQYDFTQQSF